MNIDPTLCLYSPKQVHDAILHHNTISNWLKFVSNKYQYPRKKVILIYPCSTTKPYNKSQSYRQLFKTLSRLRQDQVERVHIMTISEPFGLVPIEFCNESFTWYDCPGLFEWWCNRHKIDYDEEYLNKSIDLLADCVGESLRRALTDFGYEEIVGFVRTHTSSLDLRKDHTHRRILERVSEKFGIDIKLLPSKSVVKKVVRNRGRFAWDMYGPGHPIAQETLLRYLREKLG